MTLATSTLVGSLALAVLVGLGALALRRLGHRPAHKPRSAPLILVSRAKAQRIHAQR